MRNKTANQSRCGSINERNISDRYGENTIFQIVVRNTGSRYCDYNGCNVKCPVIPCGYREDWGLNDPTGKDDVEFSKIIHTIHTNIIELTKRVENGLIL